MSLLNLDSSLQINPGLLKREWKYKNKKQKQIRPTGSYSDCTIIPLS